LNEAGIAAHRLQIEVNESALPRQSETAALDTLAQLTESGVRLVLDKFGAGAASLEAVRRELVDGIKLDGEFMRSAAVSERDGAIVTALASLGKTLGLRVIAAGFESEDQLAFARKAGIAEAQGYLLGHPIEPEDFVTCVTAPPRRRARRK
jgi:EAL domain-containing protein (putative c-di-GMP-specific phosphodiesterase class I)